jgi:hypothetical protein
MKLTTTHKAIVVVILAVIGAWVVYPVLRPTKADLCASEILLNGRGGTINLETGTFKAGAGATPVPLESVTNDTQVVIDELSRLCRQHEAKVISTDQYFARTQELLRPPAKPAAAATIPKFDGTIGVTGLVDNRPFRKFIEDNAGKIVRLNLTMDAGAYNPLGIHFLEQCYQSQDDSGEIQSTFPSFEDNLYGQRFHLIEVEEDIQGYEEFAEDQGWIGCGPVLEFDSAGRRLTWSSAGPGLTSTVVDGFYRVGRDHMGTETTYRFEEVSAGVADYAATQS